MDSKLVVEQMAGRWKIKHPDMRRLALEARDLAARSARPAGRCRSPGSRASATRTPTPCPTTAWTAGPSTGCWAGRRRRRRWQVRPRWREVVDEVIDPAAEPSAARPGAGTPTRIVLVRHGVTDFTVASRLDGRGGADPSLNTVGQAQAAAAGRAVAHLLGGVRRRGSSRRRWPGRGRPARRWRRRSAPTRSVDPDWDEQEFGDWDGASIPDLVRDEADALTALGSTRPTPVLAVSRTTSWSRGWWRRSTAWSPRAAPPSWSATASRSCACWRTCWASRTTRSGGSLRRPAR